MRATLATIITVALCLAPSGLAWAQSPSPSEAPSPVAAMGGTVSITIDSLEGASGSRLAAILYAGVPEFASGDTPMQGLGGFVADITSDPFSTTDTIRQGPPWVATDDDPVAIVPPGIHTVLIVVSHDLHPYGEWIPADPIDAACVAHMTVSEGAETSVRLEMAEDPLTGGLPGCDVQH